MAVGSNALANEDEEKDQDKDNGGAVYFSHEVGLSFKSEIEFHVSPENSRKRGSLAKEIGGRSVIGYKKGNWRTEVGVLFESPELEETYYVKYRGRTMDLYEVNKRFSIDGWTNNISYLGSVWYDFDNSTPWTFYAGGTLGRTNVSLGYNIEPEKEFRMISVNSVIMPVGPICKSLVRG